MYVVRLNLNRLFAILFVFLNFDSVWDALILHLQQSLFVTFLWLFSIIVVVPIVIALQDLDGFSIHCFICVMDKWVCAFFFLFSKQSFCCVSVKLEPWEDFNWPNWPFCACIRIKSSHSQCIDSFCDFIVQVTKFHGKKYLPIIFLNFTQVFSRCRKQLHTRSIRDKPILFFPLIVYDCVNSMKLFGIVRNCLEMLGIVENF